RLKAEYGVDAIFEPVGVVTTRWVRCASERKLEEFREKNATNLGIDAADQLVYLAPTRVNLQLAVERWPDVEFLATREQAHTQAAGCAFVARHPRCAYAWHDRSRSPTGIPSCPP